jgi:hypothetical protein
MLTWKTLVAMLIVTGAAGIGAGFVLAQNLEAGPVVEKPSGQPQANGSPLKDPERVPAGSGTAAPGSGHWAEIGQGGASLKVLADAGAAIPGFGGYYVDLYDHRIAYVYMLDLSQQEEARRALEMVLGAKRVMREIRLLQGQYSMAQLSQWYGSVKSLLPIEGIQGGQL